jgi:5-methylcytosine-specific restriction endonuclease McrA
MSNNSKAVTLGMPHGTACGKLRKNILFHLLKKHGENQCYRCTEPIELVDELSIEHKKPWEGISADLFWDLENVAFSHMRCNRPHRNNGGRPFKKDYPL